MRYVTYILRLVMVLTAVATLYYGVLQGEWGETMFNATLL
jgi:hypothetical protein